ncbi:MAG TPA: hypothetical protein VI819_00685 [Patescibacteria group bacterium]|nr:hypothetical protein [Patescibacteria group bacterium]
MPRFEQDPILNLPEPVLPVNVRAYKFTGSMTKDSPDCFKPDGILGRWLNKSPKRPTTNEAEDVIVAARLAENIVNQSLEKPVKLEEYYGEGIVIHANVKRSKFIAGILKEMGYSHDDTNSKDSFTELKPEQLEFVKFALK